MKLREYQERAVAGLREKFAQGYRSVLCVMPTGAGKAVVGAAVTKLAVDRGSTVLFALPRIELLNQEVNKLRDAGIEQMRVIQAERDEGPADARVIVASIPTLTTERWRERVPHADLLNVDEAHHCKAETHERLLNQYPNAKIVGWSATPQRGDGRSLGDIFEALVVGATVRELMDLKALVECRVYAPDRILDPRELAMEPIEAYRKHCIGRPTLVFAQTKQHARTIAESFCGLRVATVFGESRDREETLDRFARGDLEVLVGVNVFIEGWDAPRAAAAILARKFTYVGGFLQAIGRILRPHETKQDAVVADLVGSALVHGTPDLDREFNLSGAGISKPKLGSIFRCTKCGGVSLATSTGACTYCGHARPALNRAKPKSLAEQLHELTKDFEPREWNVRHARGTRLCIECGRAIVDKAKYVFVKGGPSLHPTCAFQKARKIQAQVEKGKAA